MDVNILLFPLEWLDVMMKNVYNIDLIEKVQKMPHHYALCVMSDCPVASQCLRHMLYKENDGKETTIEVVNPMCMVLDTEGRCNFFADGVHQATYALGFLRFISGLTNRQKVMFQKRCLESMCKTVYYEMRAGQRVITPSWQTFLLRVAEQEDIPVPRHFFDFTFKAPAW